VIVDALAGFDVGISGLSAGLNMLLTVPDGSERELLQRAGEAGLALQGLSLMRHPLAGPEIPAPDGIIVGFAAAAEHAFSRAVEALSGVLRASSLGG
jgi:GntR family transcriptional regulator/MocR family aminotransferase